MGGAVDDVRLQTIPPTSTSQTRGAHDGDSRQDAPAFCTVEFVHGQPPPQGASLLSGLPRLPMFRTVLPGPSSRSPMAAACRCRLIRSFRPRTEPAPPASASAACASTASKRGLLTFRRVRDLLPEHELSSERGRRMTLEPDMVAAVFMEGRLVWGRPIAG